jgi:hypothetical protein
MDEKSSTGAVLVFGLLVELALVLLAFHLQQWGGTVVGSHVMASGVVVHLEVVWAIHRMSPDASVVLVESPGRSHHCSRRLLHICRNRACCFRVGAARRLAGAHAPLAGNDV